MVNIDEILTHYSKNGATEEIEGALWKLLYEIQRLPLVTGEARRNHKMSRTNVLVNAPIQTE